MRALALLLCLSSCAPVVQAERLDVCPEAEAFRAPLGMAVAAWSQALKGQLEITVECNYSSVPFYIESAAELDRHCPNCPSDALAVTMGSRVMVRSNFKTWLARDGAHVFSHEIGHLLGAVHVKGSLMDERVRNSAFCPDDKTMIQVAAVHNLDHSKLEPCD